VLKAARPGQLVPVDSEHSAIAQCLRGGQPHEVAWLVLTASPPDMKLPISLALGWPERVPDAAAPVTFDEPTAWTFEPLDNDTFPAVRLARQAGTAGGCLPAIYNAANEEAVPSFVGGHTTFTAIVDTVEHVLDDAHDWHHEPDSVDEVLAAEDWARTRARELLTATRGGRVGDV
jgi:1-deoxy-D-xylulose-5-phosphate reductoisomerase